MKRLLASILVTLMLTMTLASTAMAEAEQYAQAKHLLSAGRYAEAEALFASLGIYEEATLYTMYVRGILYAEGGDYATGIATFGMLGDFLDSRLLTTYYAARQKEAAQDYEGADAIYQTIIAFKDCRQRVAQLPGLIDERATAEKLEHAQHFASSASILHQVEAYQLFVSLQDAQADAMLPELLEKAASLETASDAESLLYAAAIYKTVGEAAKEQAMYDRLCETSGLLPFAISEDRFLDFASRMSKVTQKKLKANYVLRSPLPFEKYINVLPLDVLLQEQSYVLKPDLTDSQREKVAGYFAEAGYTQADYIQDLQFMLPQSPSAAQ